MTALASLLDDVESRDLQRLEKLLHIRNVRLSFAMDHHLNTRGDRMDFAHYPHIKELYESTAAELVLQGSVQSFKSEFVIIDHLAIAFCGLSVFYVLPKYETRNTYVQNRINKCVESVPEYKKIVKAGFFDSIAMKQFGKGTIKYVGSNVLADFVEFPADVLIVDEVDECNAENLEYAMDRLRASPYQFKRYLGNPREKNKGINYLYNLSSMREWHIPCFGCGKHSEADWFNTVVESIRDRNDEIVDYKLRDTEWSLGCGRDIKLICPHCNGALERASVDGRWIANNPEGNMEGFHISMLCNLINSISGMWIRFQRGVHDPIKMQQFYNSDLGLPYTAEGSKVTETLLSRCIKDYNFKIEASSGHISEHEHLGPCSMGVDVGKVFDVRVSFVEPRGARRAVFMGKVKTQDELFDIMERYNVDKCVIDINPELHLVQEIQEIAPCDVWLCTYRGEGKERKQTYNVNDRIISIDRTEALDKSYAQLVRKKNLLPKNYNSILAGGYTSEMCMPVRELTEDKKGKQAYTWSKGIDHQRHADTYDMLAAAMVQDSIIDEVVIA